MEVAYGWIIRACMQANFHTDHVTSRYSTLNHYTKIYIYIYIYIVIKSKSFSHTCRPACLLFNANGFRPLLNRLIRRPSQSSYSLIYLYRLRENDSHDQSNLCKEMIIISIGHSFPLVCN